MKRKRRVKQAAPRKRRAQPRATPESEKRVRDFLIQALVAAERHGMLRAMLKALNFTFRLMREKAGNDYQAASYRHLRVGREVVAHYMQSLFLDLDAETKSEILRDLIFEFRLTRCEADKARAKEAGMSLSKNDYGSWGILIAMRDLAYAYCAIVDEDDESLASELPIYAAELTECLQRLVERKPELVRGIAAGMIEWPIMASQHYPKKSDFKATAERIGLASKSPVKPRASHTWKPTTPVNRYLIRMLVGEGWGDGRELTKQTVPYYLDEVLMPLFENVAGEEGGWENYEEFAEIARSASKRGKTGVQKSEIRSRVKKALMALASDG